MTLRCDVDVDMGKAPAAKEYIEAAGLRVDNVSRCGTGTHTITGRLPWMTELQGGSYATMDAQYGGSGDARVARGLAGRPRVRLMPRERRG